MSQSLSKIIVHVVFSTKNRMRSIDSAVKPRLHAYIATLGRDLGGEVYRVGGTDDHVHMALLLPRTMTIAKCVERVKALSSSWVKDSGKGCHDFQWQGGYGAFSVSQSGFSTLIDYIDKQEEHHSKMSFQDELRVLLRKYGVDFDEKYLWD